jgi:cell wall-associated NlpC family hydrolase
VLLLPTHRACWFAAGLVLLTLVAPIVHAQQDNPGDAATEASMNTSAAPDATVVDAGPADFATVAAQAAQQIAYYALQMVGSAYRFGGAEPAAGFDCSGLVQYVYRQASGVDLPRTARSLSEVGTRIPMVRLRPGDLVFFNTRRVAFSHVGIYIGNNQFIHAPRRGERVEVSMIDSRYWQRRFNGARRLVGSVPGLLPGLVERAGGVDTAVFLSDPVESDDSVGY